MSHTIVTTGYSLEGCEELKLQGGRDEQCIQNFGGKNLLGNIHLQTPTRESIINLKWVYKKSNAAVSESCRVTKCSNLDLCRFSSKNNSQNFAVK
jgi:hypothetical protein